MHMENITKHEAIKKAGQIMNPAISGMNSVKSRTPASGITGKSQSLEKPQESRISFLGEF